MGLRESVLAIALASVTLSSGAVVVAAAPVVATDPAGLAERPAPFADRAGRPPVHTMPEHVDPPAPVLAAAEPQALRINHLQARGTHNSTHLDPHGLVTGGAPFNWGYSHRTLTAQFEQQGVRQVEIDVHYNWAKDDFDVYHVWFGDDRATCDTLSGCLGEARAWSDDHPRSVPLMVLIEPKDAGAPHSLAEGSTDPEAHLPEDGDPFTRPLDAAAYRRLDEVLLAAFDGSVSDGGRVLTPDDVAVPGLDLRTSILTEGWPTVQHARQKVLYVLDGPDHAEPYSRGWTSLVGRSMFVQAAAEAPVAAFVSRDGERLAGESKYDRIRRLVAEGFMVRDLTSPDEFAAALAAGAHYLSTDHPDQLDLGHPDAPVRCNPVVVVAADRDCVDTALEMHVPHGYAVPEDPPDTQEQAVVDKADRLVLGSAESVEALVGAEPGSRSPLP